MNEKVTLLELSVFCAKLIKTFSKKQLVLLEGDLGAGKTTLVQNVSRLMGYDSAESPTFSIINEYPTLPKIYHVDLYRMESAQDIDSTGFWDLFNEDNAVVFVEWPSRVNASEWPKSWAPVRVSITAGDADDQRVISVEKL